MGGLVYLTLLKIDCTKKVRSGYNFIFSALATDDSSSAGLSLLDVMSSLKQDSSQHTESGKVALRMLCCNVFVDNKISLMHHDDDTQENATEWLRLARSDLRQAIRSLKRVQDSCQKEFFENRIAEEDCKEWLESDGITYADPPFDSDPDEEADSVRCEQCHAGQKHIVAIVRSGFHGSLSHGGGCRRENGT